MDATPFFGEKLSTCARVEFMFDKKRLSQNLSNSNFTVWTYEAADREEASAARHQLGYFPLDCGLRKEDVIYIKGDGQTSHQWVDVNPAENKFTMQLFGG